MVKLLDPLDPACGEMRLPVRRWLWWASIVDLVATAENRWLRREYRSRINPSFRGMFDAVDRTRSNDPEVFAVLSRFAARIAAAYLRDKGAFPEEVKDEVMTSSELDAWLLWTAR